MTTEKTFRAPQIIPPLFAHSKKDARCLSDFFYTEIVLNKKLKLMKKLKII